MKPIKQLEQIQAKLKLLQHVRSEHNVPEDVIAAAKVKLGADLCDALSGELGAALRENIDSEVRRLEKGDIQPGDRVTWRFGNEQKSNRVISVDERSVKVDFERGYNMNRHEARPDPETLGDLRQLRDACDTAMGRGNGQINIPPGWPMPGSESHQYPTKEVED